MTLTPASTILITGANGHVAQHILSQLLFHPAGPKVVTIVRSSSSTKSIEDTFSSHIESGRLKVILVPDITDANAFVSLMPGITGIAHVPSPLAAFDTKEVERDFLQPAIRDTTAVFSAAARSSSVESVVVRGSFASAFDIAQGFRPGYTYTVRDWNPYRLYVTYMASKKLAEKAVWDFDEKQKPKRRLNFVLPTWIGGPNVLPLYRGVDGLSASQKLIWQCAVGERLPDADFPNWVDVRDVAAVYIVCLEKDDVNREMFLMGTKIGWYSGVADITQRNFPTLTPPEGKQEESSYDIDISNLQKLDVFPMMQLEKMYVDTVDQILS